MVVNRDAEYDAFGPWMIKFDDEVLLPNRFKGHVAMDIEYDLLFKVPRDIERRVAKPGMDLYDMVIGIKDRKLYIHVRDEASVRSRLVDVKEVMSIIIHTDLLSGHLHLQLVGGDLVIKFNTISLEIVQELVRLIREHYLPGREKLVLPALEATAAHQMEHYHQNTWYSLKHKEKDLSLIGYQGVQELHYKNLKPAARLYNKFIRSHLKSTMYLSNGKELIVAKNGYDFKRFRKADYSTSLTYIPYIRMIQLTTLPHGVVPEINTSTIKVVDKPFKFLFHETNKEGSHWVNVLKEKL